MKNKIIHIAIFITILTIGSLSWERNLSKTKFEKSILIKIDDIQDSGTPHAVDNVLFYVKGKKCKAFERTCPHLGCKLNPDEENNCFYCPCHGSKFSLDGEPIKGPATEKLVELKCEIDQENETLRIFYK